MTTKTTRNDKSYLELENDDAEEIEKLLIRNDPREGFRIEILDDELGRWACFNITSRATAMLMAAKLLELSLLEF